MIFEELDIETYCREIACTKCPYRNVCEQKEDRCFTGGLVKELNDYGKKHNKN